MLTDRATIQNWIRRLAQNPSIIKLAWTPTLNWKLYLHRVSLELFNLAKNIPVVLQSSPIKLEANWLRGSWVMIGHTNKQTYFIYVNRVRTRLQHNSQLSRGSTLTTSTKDTVQWYRYIGLCTLKEIIYIFHSLQ